MNAAMVPLLNSSGGYVYNAAGKPLSTLTDSAGNNLPVYNFFALPGFNDPATINAIEATLFQSGTTSLRNIQFILRGKPFTLPAGDVGFALGVEDRSEDLTASVDALFANGLALGYNPANTFSGGTRSSRGAFLEVGVPLTSASQNIPGFHSMDLNLADRYEKIQPGGNANSPKLGLRWLPINDSFAIRATYAEGFIAPTIFSLFGPSQGNSPTLSILAGDGRAGPGGSLGTQTTVQVSANQLSNPNLQASKSKSYTAGIVYSPKEIKGLTFTVDYYKISQDKVGGFDYTALAADLNAQGSASALCQRICVCRRHPARQHGPEPGHFDELRFHHHPHQSFGQPVDQRTGHRPGPPVHDREHGAVRRGRLRERVVQLQGARNSAAPYLQYARNYTDGTNGVGFANGLLPSYIIKPYITHTYGPLSTSLYFTYIPATTASGSIFNDPTDPNTDRIDGKPYKIPSYFTTDLAITYTLPNFGKSWARNTTLTVGANNLFDKAPPYVPVDGNPPGENNTVESTYDIIGRFMFVELKKAF